jgi:hypothetical protein
MRGFAAAGIGIMLIGLIAAPRASARDLYLNMVSMTSTVKPGEMATLTIRTAPNAQCVPTVRSKSGMNVSSRLGLDSKTADTQGMVSWSVRIPSGTPAGTWPVEVTCQMQGREGTIRTAVTVQ